MFKQSAVRKSSFQQRQGKRFLKLLQMNENYLAVLSIGLGPFSLAGQTV